MCRRTGFVIACAALISGGCAEAPQAAGNLFDALYRLIVGGDVIGESTLLRFYVWHIVGLIVPMVFLIGWHAFRVRRDGGISHRERAAHKRRPPRTRREVLVRTEVLAFFLTVAVMILLSVFVDAPLGKPAAEGRVNADVHAPWIFLWVQELLRVWPPAIAGVLAPLVLTALLMALPFVDRSDEGVGVWFNRQGRSTQIILVAVAIGVAALTIRAALR